MATHAMGSKPAFVTGSEHSDTRSPLEWLKATFVRLENSVIWYRQYRATAQELSALSNRELDDIGVVRCDIPKIALDAANTAAGH